MDGGNKWRVEGGRWWVGGEWREWIESGDGWRVRGGWVGGDGVNGWGENGWR